MVEELVNKYLADCIILTQELVRIPSVSKENTEWALVRYVMQKAFELDIYTQKLEYESNRPNLVLGKNWNKAGWVWFVAHADTVWITNKTKWIYDPFGGDIVEGKLYGRWTVDCKAGIALTLYAIKILHELWYPEAAKWLICVDEENGANSSFGVRSVLEDGFQAQWVLYVFWGTNTWTYLNIWHRWLMRVVITCTGEEIHTWSIGRSTKNRGEDAISALVEVLSHLQASRPFGEETHPYFPSYVTSFTPIHITGGQYASIVPWSAEVALDVRTLPWCSHDTIKKFLAWVLDSYAWPKKKFSLKCLSEVEATVIDIEAPFVQSTVAYLKESRGVEEITYKWVWPANETYLFARKGIPVLTGIGPKGWNAHGSDEFVSVESFWTALTDLIEIALRVRNKK